MDNNISIVIPIYNSEKYIKRCLDSIVKQINDNILEILVIDDCSTDNSLQILKEYENDEKRIKIIEKKINSGVSNSRNIGINKAKGDYIMFIDSDDFLAENAIESLTKMIKLYDYDLIKFNYFKYYDNFTYKKIKDNSIYNKLSNEEILLNFINGNIDSYIFNALFKRDILLRTNLFDEEIIMMEDRLLYLEILKVIKKIHFSNEYLYYYYVNHNGASKSITKIENNIYNLSKLNCKAKKILENNDMVKIFNSVTIKYYLRAISNLYKYNKKIWYQVCKNNNLLRNIKYSEFSLYYKVLICCYRLKLYIIIRVLYYIRNIIKEGHIREKNSNIDN